MKEEIKFYDSEGDEIPKIPSTIPFKDLVWWNEDTDLSFSMPPYLKPLVDNIKLAIEVEHELAFDYYCEAISYMAKQAAISGKITEHQCQILLHNWGYK